MYQYICNIFNLNDIFLSITSGCLLSNWKYCHINKDLLLSNHLFLRNLLLVTVARDP